MKTTKKYWALILGILGFTNGLMSESMLIWFVIVYLEIGRKHHLEDEIKG